MKHNQDQYMLPLFDDDSITSETSAIESNPSSKFSIEEVLMRRRGQFLVHSFMYYVLNDSIISDEKYDSICRELAELQAEHSKLAAQLPYHDICSRLDESGSGFYIQDYPNEIMGTACRLLADERHEDFQSILARVGLRVIGPGEK